MDRLNVIVVTTSYPVAERSVSGIFVARLLDAMPASVQVTVLAPAAAAPKPPGTASGIRVKLFRYAPERWQILAHRPGGIPVALRRNPMLYTIVPFFLLRMFIALFRGSKDAQIIHANWSICGFIAGLVGRLRRIPVVTTLRGEDLNRATTSRVHKFLVRSTLRSSCRIVTVSDAFKMHIDQEYPEYRTRCETICNGVSDEFIRLGSARFRADAAIERSPDAPLRLVSVGSLIPRKGMDVILRAIARLADPGQVLLSIAGDGAEKDALRSLARELGVDSQVALIGEQAPTEIAELLNSHDVFILASHSEGRPNVVLEAKAAGLAVLASNIDGVREIIDHSQDGLLFDDDSDEQLAAQIEHLLRRPEDARRFAKQAHRSIVDSQLT